MNRSCDLCGSTAIKAVIEIPYLNVDSQNQSVTINQCPICGFVYKRDLENKEKLDVKNGKTDRYGLYESMAIEFYQMQEVLYLKNFLKGNERILDIGCNDGAIIQKLSEEYPEIECYGIDISEASCLKAAQRGLKVFNKSIYDEIDELDEGFDVIILSQVLEHLTDLRQIVKRIYELLKNEGVAFITVPDDGNTDSLLGNITSILSLEHRNHFSSKTLNRLFTSENFERIDCKILPVTNIRDELHIIMAIFEKKPDLTADGIKLSYQSYVNEKNQLKEYFKEMLGKSEYVIWGASHMAMNFIGNVLSVENLRYIVDADPAKQGGYIGSIPIKAPDDLRCKPNYKIVVLPILFENDILDMIKKMEIKNKVIQVLT